MWSGYWTASYWNNRYWTHVARRAPTPCGTYGDGGKYGDGSLYCSASSRRGLFEIRYDAVAHYVSVQIQASGKFVLDSLIPIVRIKKT